MSPTILRELLAIKRWNRENVRVIDEHVGDLNASIRYQEYWAGGLKSHLMYDDVRVLRASLPFRRYCEEREAEEKAQRAAGGRELCPLCGTRTVVSRSVLTYGVPSNPNSEYSVYSRCENTDCDWEQI